MVTEKSKKSIKVAIITNIPTPYRKKQWEYYSKCKFLDITVFYCADIEDRLWDINSAEGIKEVFLKGLSYKSYHLNLGILKVIFKDFDVFFVGGYGYPSLIMAIMGLKILRKPWIMIIDGVSPINLNKENKIGHRIKKFFINDANAYFANGSVSKQFLMDYEVKSNKIFNQFLTVDVNDFFSRNDVSNKIRSEIREKHGINTNSIVIMYSGRLIEHKGVQELIESLKTLIKHKYDIKALIVGEGNYKKELLKKLEDFDSDIIFVGNKPPEEIYKYYYASDIFVLPTHNDPWGLVVNEAMACGLPVIVTSAAGSSMDLVKNNGYVVKAHDVNDITSCIEKLLNNKTRTIAGNNSKKLISNWTYEESLNSFIEILKYLKLFR